MLLTKKTTHMFTKSLPFYVSRLSKPSLSTAYERAEGSNAVAEGNDGGVTREGMYKGADKDMTMSNDKAREGPIKAEEEGYMVNDTAKESMDGAWIAAKEASHEVDREKNTEKKCKIN